MVRERIASSLVIARDLGTLGRARYRPRDRCLRWCRRAAGLPTRACARSWLPLTSCSIRARSGWATRTSTKLGTLDEVEGWAGFAINDSNFDEPPGGAPFIAVGDGWFDTIERAKVLEGRLPDPDADDEAVVDVAATKLGEDVRVGSVFTWRSLSAEQGESFPDGAPPDFDWTTAAGPVTKLRIVGIVRLPMQPVVSFASGGLAIVGPGWAKAHLDETRIFFTNALVRLENGAADVPKFKASVSQLYGRDDIPVKDLSVDIKRVQRSVELEQTALRSVRRGGRRGNASCWSARACSDRCAPARQHCRCCGRWASVAGRCMSVSWRHTC